MTWRAACIVTPLLLLPMAAVLALRGSVLALLYAAAAVVAVLYHWHHQRRFSRADHWLAWACIAGNCWLLWCCQDWRLGFSAVCCILLALERYIEAHRGDYYRHHTVWHWWCGLAGWLLAMGYRP